MNTNQLRKILHLDPKTRMLDSRVLSVNQLPNDPQPPFAYIVNTDKANESGEHWFALFKENTEKEVEFFDSYGLPLVLYPNEVETFVKELGPHYREQNTMIQSPISLTCGEHAAFFILQRSRGKSFEEIVSNYTDNQKKNDEFVYRYIHEKYPGTEPTLYAKIDFVKKILNERGI